MTAQHSLALEIGFGIIVLIMHDVAFKLFDSLGHSFTPALELGTGMKTKQNESKL